MIVLSTPWFAATLVFLSVVSVAMTMRAWGKARAPAPELAAMADPLSAIRQRVEVPAGARLLAEVSQPITAEGAASLSQELVQAGVRDPLMQASWHASRVVGSLFFGIVAFTLLASTSPMLQGTAVLLTAFIGFQFPRLVLGEMRRRRQHRVSAGVPTMLDLLVSAVEGGLGVDAALRHVGLEMKTSAPDLAEELDHMNAEVTTGTPRPEALRRLAERTGLQSLFSLANTLGQVERQGAGIARSIRAHVRLERRRRMLDADARAAQAAPKMTVVMILFLMPALFIILLGPGVINVSEFLQATEAGESR